MNWNNILPILAPVLIGLWAIMRSIKEEMRSIKSDLKEDIRSVESNLKEDIRAMGVRLNGLEARMSGIEKESAAINVKIDFLGYESRDDRKHG